jgi:hypothetical protein
MSEPIGDTARFVQGVDFFHERNTVLLRASDGTKRAFAEVIADYDDPSDRPEEATRALLQSLKMGWVIRFTQVYWPEAEIRQAFLEHVQRSMTSGESKEAVRSIFYDGLLLALHPTETPLPFARRTFMEFFVTDEISLDWWESLAGVLQRDYGIQLIYLDQAAITNISKWILNPQLEEE